MKQNQQSKKNELKRMCGAAVPLGALRNEQSPVVGEYTTLISFAQLCKKCGLSIIQLLPVNDTGTQSSPYSGLSAFALHPVYISLSAISEFSNLYKSNEEFATRYDNFINNHKDDVRWDYQEVCNEKDFLLRNIFDSILKSKEKAAVKKELDSFIKKNNWLPSYCIYKNLKWKHMQASWKSWPKEEQNISEDKINNIWKDSSLQKAHLFYVWEQYIAHKQFFESSEKIKSLSIILKGDLPILMNEDSCDVWANPKLFSLKNRAGSPPDADNPSGQNWGFPTYNWKEHEANNFSWWKERLSTASQFYNAYRLDHILGFFRIWAIPEGNSTATLGHTEPYSAIKRDDLTEDGFSKDRIHWLSEPHVPTNALTDKGLSLEEAHTILNKICDRLGDEELWNFKKEIKSENDINNILENKNANTDNNQYSVYAETLKSWWNNRTLIEITKDNFIPSWQHESTQAWQFLNEEEKKSLNALFSKAEILQENKWKKQAEKILKSLTSSTKMIPCGEDLGVNLPCVPLVLQENNILSLNVVRWCRKWATKNQPYIPFDEYRDESVVTTSVHDSSTLRQWWNNEKNSAREFEKSFDEKIRKILAANLTKSGKEEEEVKQAEDEKIIFRSDSKFTPEDASFILSKSAQTSGKWFINPLQDWLYLKKDYWYKDENNERINIPGTVSTFNWTYRISKDIENIFSDENISKKIKEIVNIHNETHSGGYSL